MNEKSKLLDKSVKRLRLICLAIIFFMLVFGAIAYGLIITDSVSFDEAGMGKIFTFLVPGFLVLMLLFSSYYFRFNLTVVRKNPSFESKLKLYQSATIVRFALLEGPGLLAIVAYLFTGSLTFLLLAIVTVGYLYFMLPSRSRILTDLTIHPRDMEED